MNDAPGDPSVHPTVALYEWGQSGLVVGGIDLPRLAARVGSTPFFAYDRAKITARITQLRAALSPRIQLSYAVKANPMPALVDHVNALVDHLDVASAGELRIALDTGRSPERISFAGPGKVTPELRQAVAAGVTIEIESSGEARRVVAVGDELGLRPRVAVRVNPEFSVRGSGMRMGGGSQQFGVDSEAVPHLLRDLSTSDVDVLGFHVFAGSQNLYPDVLAEAQRQTAALIRRLGEALHSPVRYVNLGGGFGVPYASKDKPLDVDQVGETLSDVVESDLAPYFPEASFVIELGRFLVAEAGVYVTRVVDVKYSRGRRYLVVDGGLHHQLAASGNFGSAVRRNYPVIVGSRQPDPISVREASVVGCLCTPLDLLADRVELPDEADVDDLVVVFHAGAYGYTASPTRFLGHPEPIEVLV